jgi:hypothetical protein
MINNHLFKASRESARLKMDAHEAKNSFGYFIDVPNDWEGYSSPEGLIQFLGIHNTHQAFFQEILEDLYPLTDSDKKWIFSYVEFYEQISRLITTTDMRVDLKHDIAESIFDWQRILQHVELPCRILDFGAGCSRQGVSAYFRNSKIIYTAVDSIMASYTIQDLVLSYLKTLNSDFSFYDFLDYEEAGKPFPDISKASPSSSYHVPLWLAESNLPKKFYDVIIASHVHNELSEPDFLRLTRLIDKTLAPDGIVYVRSELIMMSTADFFDAVNLHGRDIVSILSAMGIIPVYCKYESNYMTTIFARKGSTHHKNALASNAPEHSFMKVNKAMTVSWRTSWHFMRRTLHEIRVNKSKVIFIGGNYLISRFLFSIVGLGINEKVIYSEKSFMEDKTKGFHDGLKKFNPDAVVILSRKWPAIKHQVEVIFGDIFSLRRHHLFPVIFMQLNGRKREDLIFTKPIFGLKDLVDDGQSGVYTSAFPKLRSFSRDKEEL